MAFNLQSFLESYMPKNIISEMAPYTISKKLAGYTFVDKTSINRIVPGKTYVKYIRINEAFKDTKYDDHIRAGGIVLWGGIVIDGLLEKVSDPKKWTHLVIKYTSSVDKNITKIFRLNMSNYYLFYRRFNDTNEKMRDMLIELL